MTRFPAFLHAILNPKDGRTKRNLPPLPMNAAIYERERLAILNPPAKPRYRNASKTRPDARRPHAHETLHWKPEFWHDRDPRGPRIKPG